MRGVAPSVATPLETQLGRIAGVTQMTSSSSLGSSRIVLQFELSGDIDGAARDVRRRAVEDGHLAVSGDDVLESEDRVLRRACHG